jgi:hypothetical protein
LLDCRLGQAMTVSQFRKLAVSLPGVEERAHMGHPDFRVAGKIFATLGYPDKDWGMVALTPEQQQDYLQSHPDVFVRAAGAWGRRGATLVRLKAADPEAAGGAMTAAWKNRARKKPPAGGRPVRRSL